jgi:hypothetical protein
MAASHLLQFFVMISSTNTEQTMSYKIRAASASHQFGNLSALYVRQVCLIELTETLSS